MVVPACYRNQTLKKRVLNINWERRGRWSSIECYQNIEPFHFEEKTECGNAEESQPEFEPPSSDSAMSLIDLGVNNDRNPCNNFRIAGSTEENLDQGLGWTYFAKDFESKQFGCQPGLHKPVFDDVSNDSVDIFPLDLCHGEVYDRDGQLDPDILMTEHCSHLTPSMDDADNLLMPTMNCNFNASPRRARARSTRIDRPDNSSSENTKREDEEEDWPTGWWTSTEAIVAVLVLAIVLTPYLVLLWSSSDGSVWSFIFNLMKVFMQGIGVGVSAVLFIFLFQVNFSGNSFRQLFQQHIKPILNKRKPNKVEPAALSVEDNKPTVTPSLLCGDGENVDLTSKSSLNGNEKEERNLPSVNVCLEVSNTSEINVDQVVTADQESGDEQAATNSEMSKPTSTLDIVSQADAKSTEMNKPPTLPETNTTKSTETNSDALPDVKNTPADKPGNGEENSLDISDKHSLKILQNGDATSLLESMEEKEVTSLTLPNKEMSTGFGNENNDSNKNAPMENLEEVLTSKIVVSRKQSKCRMKEMYRNYLRIRRKYKQEMTSVRANDREASAVLSRMQLALPVLEREKQTLQAELQAIKTQHDEERRRNHDLIARLHRLQAQFARLGAVSPMHNTSAGPSLGAAGANVGVIV